MRYLVHVEKRALAGTRTNEFAERFGRLVALNRLLLLRATTDSAASLHLFILIFRLFRSRWRLRFWGNVHWFCIRM